MIEARTFVAVSEHFFETWTTSLLCFAADADTLMWEF